MTDCLYVGSRVGNEDANEWKVLDFGLVDSMIGQMPPDEIYTLPPFKTSWTKARDTVFTPISIKRLVVGVEAALRIVQDKGKVLVSCLQGKR